MIVVEGKNDAHAIRRALGEVDVIWTEGFGLTEDKLRLIAEMAQRRGVIICTDPDFVGKQIRDRISKRIPEAMHVFVPRREAANEKGDDIGVENVSPEDIRKAFEKVLNKKKPMAISSDFEPGDRIEIKDLLVNGLVGQEKSAEKRNALGRALGVGDNNAKQFLYRLNRFKISREDFLKALDSIERDDS